MSIQEIAARHRTTAPDNNPVAQQYHADVLELLTDHVGYGRCSTCFHQVTCLGSERCGGNQRAQCDCWIPRESR